MKRSIGTGLAAVAAGGLLSACASGACCERTCRPCCDPCASAAHGPQVAAPTNPWLAAARAHGRGSGAVWSWIAKSYDADRDGKVSATEYPRGEKTFARLDRDGDQALTAVDFSGPTHMDEYVAALVLTRIAVSLPKSADAAAPGSTAGESPADDDLPDDETLVRTVAAIDADRDGRVREDELIRALTAAQSAPVAGVPDLPKGVRAFPSLAASMDADRSGDFTAAEATAWASRLRKKEAEGPKGPPPGAMPEGPKVGDDAPDFTLSSRDGKTRTTLSSFAGKRPVALIFGSYTCPPFRKAAPAIRRAYEAHGRDVQFFFVYIREAHSVDGRAPMPAEDQPLVEDPKTLEERTAVASACAVDFGFDAFETLVDGVDDKVARAYMAPPVRLYVVGADGKVAYKSGRGPFGMDPAAFEAAVEDAAARARTRRVLGPTPVPLPEKQ
jgi:hypothetical protein